ncbi:ABC transporter permease [Paenibacillus glycinis]|uniref:ABC transporter permease n=1 Tax=Paenibacillus glycinis TaxID=2697035 RepID=A0ABW9XKI8_9BACL|nr:ABC transporter permease [Paenibacillus glycinis]NBD23116.1 hypothetical protein [Paenibacillus glycinis]
MRDLAVNWRVGTLFRRRLKRFWAEQWRAWRTALDWTVWVYFILPLLWIGGGTYLDIWHHPPDWLRQLPMWTGERLPLVVVFVGRLRTFAEEADVLFLLQRRTWGRGMMLRGAAYTAAVLLFLTALVYAVLLPFFVAVHHFSAATLVTMIVYTWAWACIGAVWRNLLEARFSGFRKWLVKTAVLLLLAITYLIPMIYWGSSPARLLPPILIGAAAFALLLRVKLRARDAFESDTQQEQLARLASTQFLLRNVMERKPRIRLRRPLLLRNSKRIFKRFDGETLLGEMIIKAYVRRFPLVRTWLAFNLLSAVGLILTPAVIQPYVAIALMLLFSTWITSHWRGMMAEPYFAQFRWPDAVKRKSAGRVRFWLVVPSAGLFGMICGLKAYGAWGLLAIVPGVLIWIVINSIVTSTMLLSDRKAEEA